MRNFNLWKTEIKLFHEKQIETPQHFFQHASALLDLYKLQFQEIYKNQDLSVEKGERLWNDDFLLILSDIAWELFSKFEKIEKKEFEFLLKILAVLETGFFLSKYNFDIAIRLMKYYSLVGNLDRFIEIYRTLDIKGI